MIETALFTGIFAGAGYLLGSMTAAPPIAVAGSFAAGYLITSIVIDSICLPLICLISNVSEESIIAERKFMQESQLEIEKLNMQRNILEKEIELLEKYPEKLKEDFFSKSTHFAENESVSLEQLNRAYIQLSALTLEKQTETMKDLKLGFLTTCINISSIAVRLFTGFIIIPSLLIQAKSINLVACICFGSAFLTLYAPIIFFEAVIVTAYLVGPRLCAFMSKKIEAEGY